MPVTVLVKAVCWLKLAQKESVSTISAYISSRQDLGNINASIILSCGHRQVETRQTCSCFCYTSLTSASNVNSPQTSLCV